MFTINIIKNTPLIQRPLAAEQLSIQLGQLTALTKYMSAIPHQFVFVVYNVNALSKRSVTKLCALCYVVYISLCYTQDCEST